MKIKEEYVLQKITDTWFIVNTNARSVNFNKILALNDAAKLLWETLQGGADEKDLVDVLLREYEIDGETAQTDVERFVQKLQELGCVEDEE